MTTKWKIENLGDTPGSVDTVNADGETLHTAGVKPGEHFSSYLPAGATFKVREAEAPAQAAADPAPANDNQPEGNAPAS